MSKSPSTTGNGSFPFNDPEEPTDGSVDGFDSESIGECLTRVAKKIGSKLVEKALLAFFVLVDLKTPNGARLILAAALAYLVLPTDAIPDWLPVGGFADDAAALASAIAAIADHIRVRHLRQARRRMNDWGIDIDRVPEAWDDDALLHDADTTDNPETP